MADFVVGTFTGLKFAATQVPSSDANTLDNYEEYTAASAACTGAITTAAVWRLTVIGNTVTLHLPLVQGAGVATSNFAFGTAIPAEYRPATNIGWPTLVTDNGADLATPGRLTVTSATGVINVYKNLNATGNYTVTATAGMASATSVSWLI